MHTLHVLDLKNSRVHAMKKTDFFLRDDNKNGRKRLTKDNTSFRPVGVLFFFVSLPVNDDQFWKLSLLLHRLLRNNSESEYSYLFRFHWVLLSYETSWCFCRIVLCILQTLTSVLLWWEFVEMGAVSTMLVDILVIASRDILLLPTRPDAEVSSSAMGPPFNSSDTLLAVL